MKLHPRIMAAISPAANFPLQAQQAGGAPEFKYSWIMIDKSKTEIAAVRLLVLAGNAKGHLLCYFHFLQDWERFLVSKESGVSKQEKNDIMVDLAELMHCGSEEVFKAKASSAAVYLHTPCWGSAHAVPLCSSHARRLECSRQHAVHAWLAQQLGTCPCS